jgi:general secretion pathway protein M
MKLWWLQLDKRQQRLIMIAGAVLLGAIIYVGMWEPLALSRQAERERVAEQQALHDWLNAIAPMVEQLRREGDRATDLGGRSLLGLTDATARAAGLAGALSRIEPAGDGQVRVWLENADFLTTINWLQQLSLDYPIEVSHLGMDRSGREGQVNVRLTLSTNA